MSAAGSKYNADSRHQGKLRQRVKVDTAKQAKGRDERKAEFQAEREAAALREAAEFIEDHSAKQLRVFKVRFRRTAREAFWRKQVVPAIGRNPSVDDLVVLCYRMFAQRQPAAEWEETWDRAEYFMQRDMARAARTRRRRRGKRKRRSKDVAKNETLERAGVLDAMSGAKRDLLKVYDVIKAAKWRAHDVQQRYGAKVSKGVKTWPLVVTMNIERLCHEFQERYEEPISTPRFRANVYMLRACGFIEDLHEYDDNGVKLCALGRWQKTRGQPFPQSIYLLKVSDAATQRALKAVKKQPPHYGLARPAFKRTRW